MKVDSLESQLARKSWPSWATVLSKYGLADMVTWLLDALGPLKVLGAQIMHFGEPFLNSSSTGTGFTDMLNLLEDPDECQAFIAYLKGKSEI